MSIGWNLAEMANNGYEDACFARMIFFQSLKMVETKDTAGKQLQLVKRRFSEEGMQYISGNSPSPSVFYIFEKLEKFYFFWRKTF